MLKFVSVALTNSTRKGQQQVLGALLQSGDLFDVSGFLSSKNQAVGPSSLENRQTTMMDLIKGPEKYVKEINEKVQNGDYKRSEVIKKGSFKVLAPLMPERNVFCIGKNYKDHVAEINDVNARTGKGTGEKGKTFDNLVVFTKAPQTCIGPGEGIENHGNLTKWLDYEVELAVIIGKKGKNIAIDDAMSHVFGYVMRIGSLCSEEYCSILFAQHHHLPY